MQNTMGCQVPVETVEMYSMGNLPESETIAFEGHFFSCRQCVDLLVESDEWIELIKVAAPSTTETPERH
jgi:hypothetical protein